MTELVITRGAPGSGKSTWARGWVAEKPGERARVNRDDFRVSVVGKPAPISREEEELVTVAQAGTVKHLLRNGYSVVVDDTCVNMKRVKYWADFARNLHVPFTVNESFREVPIAICKERNNRRAIHEGRKLVPDEVIEDMYARLGNSPAWNPDAEYVGNDSDYVYIPDTSLPQAWLFDIDGTLAHMNGKRGPFEWHNVEVDDCDDTVATVLEAIRYLESPTPAIIIFSGRDEAAREGTEAWLKAHGIPYDFLYMREKGDMRKDSVVKLEMFRRYLVEDWWVRGVFDDRNQVVDMWRAIGLKCFQVAEGNF